MLQLSLPTSWGPLRLAGGSRAGEGSLVILPQFRLALDAGRAARALVPMTHVVVSHGHMDHLQGLLGWASQRHLQAMGDATVFAPRQTAAGITRLLETAAELEGGKPYAVEVSGVEPGDRVVLRREITLRFFATSHWVDTAGCCIEWKRRRLREDLAEESPEALQRRRTAGEEITEQVVTPLVAYLSDTGPEVFDREPWLAEVEVLIVECTFLHPEEMDRADRFGHMHLDHLVQRATFFRNRHVVLTHLSRRHRLGPGERIIREALAPVLGPQLHLFNVEWM